MIWTPTIPVASGQYRWRESDRGRVHQVRVTLQRGERVYACKTMDLRRVMSCGEWSLARATDSVPASSSDLNIA
jgi:hypothetical protein